MLTSPLKVLLFELYGVTANEVFCGCFREIGF